MKRNLFKAVLGAFLSAVLAACLSVPSWAAVKITIENNRSHSMSFAFFWIVEDNDGRRSGWYIVPSGETKTYTFKDAMYSAEYGGNFCYYATGGGRVWEGIQGPECPFPVFIHPTKKFDGAFDIPISGGKSVFFRRIPMKQTGEWDGTGKLTFDE